jgi:uncharacterized protein YjbI with pentapeptide repeats
MPETCPTCRIHEKYSWIECRNPAMPGDAHGLCILHSLDKGKNPDDFNTALQARWNQEGQESYDFRGVFFPGLFDPREFFDSKEFTKPVDFAGATFTAGANFIAASFTKAVIFSGASFMGDAYFRGASFTGDANFSEATFTKEADFSRATFTEGANFSVASFTAGADFSWATFKESAYFSWAAVGGWVVFQDINPQDEAGRAPPFMGNFWKLEFQDRGVLRFQDVSLAHCTFTGTDLRRPEFQHVTWGSWRCRQIIYDEVKLREKEKGKAWHRGWFRSQVLPWLAFQAPYEPPPETPWGDRYGQVERLYRYLKINYLTEQDYKNAGDFHYGEMEMHRRASQWRWFPFYWYNLYRLLSGYGERPSWALGWLAVFLVGLAALVWGLGLEVGNPPTLASFGDSFIYLLQKATLQRPTWAEPVGFGGKLLAGLSVLFIPGQAALFLLALRNRLGRRR